MDFQEFGKEDGKTMLLLPGTACRWQFNFGEVIDALAEHYHIIAVNYDGFEGDPNICYTDVPTVTRKIEDYIIEKHGGRVDGCYGSSLGGSHVGLLVQNGRIHIDHAYIGSSDLDQGSPIVARIMTWLFAPMLAGACKSAEKREKLKARIFKMGAIGGGASGEKFFDAFIDNMAYLHPDTIMRQYYSDYVTPLANDIDVPGTTIHVIYALQMGKKYGQRYHQHFKNPDIHEYDMKHEVWLYDPQWMPTVLDMIYETMARSSSSVQPLVTPIE